MKRSALIHPFLFTVISIIYSYWVASSTISFEYIFRPLFFFLLLLILIAYPIHKVTMNWDWTGFSLSAFVLSFYYKKDVFLIVASSTVFLVFLWVLLTKIRKKRVKAEEISVLLNFLSGVLIIIGGVKTISLFSKIPFSYYQEAISHKNRTVAVTPISRQVNPDIYYIVLDGYARADVLKELYGFDNSYFIDALKEKGFIIPSDNHSNYPKTALSVPSTLNMDYIQNFSPGLEESYFWWLMSPFIQYSETRMMLEKMGYETVSVSSDWTITNNKTADIYYRPRIQLSEFESYLLHNTPLTLSQPLLDKEMYIPLSVQAHREMVLFNIQSLSEISQLSGPQFVFSHIISPHPPFIFDKDGNFINSDEPFSLADAEGFHNEKSEKERNLLYREGYIGQVEYLNTRITKVVDDILQNSATPPIIIIQADHGSGLLTDFNSSEKTCLHERFSPFAAYYLPNIDKNAIPSDITPVNLFRIIFNEYFETNLPLLENAYYFSEDPFYLYQMEEISLQRINTPCETQP